MPRKPTGRPTGRPPGSGQLGLGLTDDQERLSIRIPRTLYTRFEAFAAGRSFHRASPQLAKYVREAMEEYLERHTSRQTGSVPGAKVRIIDRHEEEDHVSEDASIAAQLQAKRLRLGNLCKRGHTYLDTGMSLRRFVQGDCLACTAEKKQAQRAARHS